MNNLEKYLDQVIEQGPVAYDAPLDEPPQEVKPNFFQGVARRWYIVLLVIVAVSAVGLPLVWVLVEPRYIVQGAVRVAPAVDSILAGQAHGTTGNAYRDFVNTQAKILTSGPVLRRIADELTDRDLGVFSGRPQNTLEEVKDKIMPKTGVVDPAAVLKALVASQTITASHLPQSELVAVTMKGPNANEAKQIVDAFLHHYRATYGADSVQEDNNKLSTLELTQKELLAQIDRARKEMRTLADEYGTMELDARQDMEMQSQAVLLQELTRLEARRIALEANMSLLKETKLPSLSPDQLVAARKEYVNSDPMITELSANIVLMERDLLIARQNFKPGTSALARQEQVLESFKKTVEEKRAELGEEFDATLDDRLKEAAQQRLANAQAEIDGLEIHLELLRKELTDQDMATQKVGRTNLDIQDFQYDLGLDTEMYKEVSRKIKLMEIERQRRPRITPAYAADVISTQDRRIKLAAAVFFGAMACGAGLAFLRDKMDKTLQTPADVTRHLGLPVLGTTTSSRTVKPAQFAEQIAGDYQTIRTNLRLLTNGGMPRKLSVCSPGMREGKTTFAVNLATSLAKSGKKVLLIDGDLRKPDVRYMLKISNGTAGVQEVLMGEDPSQAIVSVPESGLHVLPANARNMTDVYELLVSSTAADQIDRLGRDYDHVIIDTPPALAFPDALVWAKLTDAVVLVGFAGQTTAPDFKETKERFARIRARVLGAILSNVPAEQSLYRYGYGYRTHAPTAGGRSARKSKLLLPTSDPAEEADA